MTSRRKRAARLRLPSVLASLALLASLTLPTSSMATHQAPLGPARVAPRAIPAVVAAGGNTYVPVIPNRLVDSRTRLGLSSRLSAAHAQTFTVTNQSADPAKNVPTDAIAVTGNLTVTAQTAAGYFSLGPLATNSPSFSTLNFPLGDDRANGLTVALGAGGTLSVTYVAKAGAAAQVVFDVTGYFVPDAAIPNWSMYHDDLSRTGAATGFPAVGSLSTAWTATLDGAVYGQPLGAAGRIYAATENDTVYALDPATGGVLWSTHLGTPVPLGSLPCGNIDPLGITSTPVYDAPTGTMFVVAEVSGPAHVLFAINAATGAVRWSRSVDLSGDSPTTHQQRAALAIANGYVYVGFGGLSGDCGQYRGKVVGVPASGLGATIAYRVPVAREGAVWATGGPVIDATGNLYVSIGNGSSTTTYDGSDSVVELSPTLGLKSRFAPSTWADDNAHDKDLGSMSPVLLPGGRVFIAGKSGTGYVLRQGALGGIGGQVSSATVCQAFGGAAQSGSTVYVPCSDGIRMITIGSTGVIAVGWHTTSGAHGPPVIGGGAIWSVDTSSGTLFALSPATGAIVTQISVGSLPHFASPTLWNGLVLVGTLDGVSAVTP